MPRVRFITSEDEAKEIKYPIADDEGFADNVCYNDGSPIKFRIGDECILKVGKRRIIKLIFVSASENNS